MLREMLEPGRRLRVCVVMPARTLAVDRRRCARASLGRQYIQEHAADRLQALALALQDANF